IRDAGAYNPSCCTEDNAERKITSNRLYAVASIMLAANGSDFLSVNTRSCDGVETIGGLSARLTNIAATVKVRASPAHMANAKTPRPLVKPIDGKALSENMAASHLPHAIALSAAQNRYRARSIAVSAT